MAVQFNCSSCGKPIEIDDEFAGQSVTCPYCRTVVRAVAGGVAPVASPLGEGFGAGAPPQIGGTPFPPSVPMASNWFATVGFLCSLLVILSFCVAFGTLGKQFQQQFPNGQATPEQTQKLVEQAVKEPSMVAASWCVMLSALTGTVFSILGLVKRRGRRWQAIVGLTICGLFAMCVGLLLVTSVAGALASKPK